MAVRINLKKVDKPSPKFDAVFSGDRTQALANMELTPAAALTTTPVETEAGGASAAVDGEGAVAPAAPAPDMAASAMALRMVHAEAKAPTAEAAPARDEGSDAILEHSAKPATMKAVAIVLKWSLIGGILLGGGYYLMRHVLFPVAAELQKAKSPAPVAVDKQASSLVQAVQQARVTVAKNDAKVDYLNEIIEVPKVAVKPAAAEVAPTEPVRTAARPAVAKNLSSYREAVEALKVTAVMDGEPPRLFIDNIIVKPGDVVNRPLGLSFAGMDTVERVLYFTNKENELFKKTY